MSEILPQPEQEARKTWLGKLSEFIEEGCR